MSEEVINDERPAYVLVIRDAAPRAVHTQCERHRASGPDTTPIARSHMPTLDRLRPMCGLPSIRTGQPASEGFAFTWAVHRGHVAQARAAYAIFDWLADGLRVAA